MAAATLTTDKIKLDGVSVVINYAREQDSRVNEDEVRAYLKRAHEKFPYGKLDSLTLDVDGDDVGIHYGLAPAQFDRIRRITGYLVGTLDRFNDGKRAEEHDRVKHAVPTCCR